MDVRTGRVSAAYGSNVIRGRVHRSGRGSLWCSEDRPTSRLRKLNVDRWKAVIFGECLTSDVCVARELSGATSARAALLKISRFPGRYGVLVYSRGEAAVAGDLAGIIRIWFRPGRDSVEFATSPLPLAYDSGLQLDRNALAARLLCADFTTGLNDGSLFHGVAELSPGRILVVKGRHISLADRPLEREPVDPTAAGDALRSALLTAVEERVSGALQVTADLSGGLDSSTLALLAASCHRHRVRTITYADDFAANDDDIDHAQRISTREPALDRVVVHGDADALPFTSLRAAPFTDLPSLETVIWARTRARLAPAFVSGATVHFVGDGGDIVLGAPLTYLGDLLQRRRLAHLISDSRAWARLRNRPVHRVLRAAAGTARTGYHDTLNALAQTLETPATTTASVPRRSAVSLMEDGITWASLSDAAEWATHGARVAVAQKLQAAAAEAPPVTSEVDAHGWRMLWRHGAATRAFVDVADRLGVRIAAPFFDNQVIDACYAVAPADRVSVYQAKPLLRSALAETLPPELFARRTKGDYGSCEYHGVRRNSAYLRSLLRESRLGDLGVIRPGAVLCELDRAINGGPAAMAALGDVVAAEIWLRGLEEHVPAGARSAVSAEERP
nr:albusnodin/ikarugamycin family macrolactam cyclase [Nocardiopsis mwathae]